MVATIDLNMRKRDKTLFRIRRRRRRFDPMWSQPVVEHHTIKTSWRAPILALPAAYF
jgi:hypothetical protein